MTQAAPRPPSARRRAAVILFVAALLFLPSVWTRDLWSPDEPKYAESAREMASRGDFILPHLNGDVYSEKPPLFFWLSIAAEWIPGVPAGAGGRLVSALASAATLLLTWRIGAALMGEATGTLAALLTATSLVFCQLAQSGVIDPLLTLCCTAAALGFARHRRGARWGILLFYASCAAGVLAKGPVGLLIPALAAMTWVVLEEGAKGLAALHPAWGIPLVAAPVLIWLAAATARGGVEYAQTMLVRQNLGRAMNAFVHREPLHYFVMVLPVAFLPWTFFLPQALAASLKEKVGRVRPMLFPFAWFASTFVLFSIISSKKTRYMMPLFPAAALLVAGWMMRRMLEPSGRIDRGRAAILAIAAAGTAFAAALAAPAIAGPSMVPHRLMAPLAEPGSEEALAAVRSMLTWPGNLEVLVPALVFGGACVWALFRARARRGEAIAGLLVGWTLLLAAGTWLWVPVLNEAKSARRLAEEIRRMAPDAQLYYVRSIHAASINFYLEADRIPLLRKPLEIRDAAREPRARFIGSRGDLLRLSRGAGLDFEFQTCRRVGEEVLCLAAATSLPAAHS